MHGQKKLTMGSGPAGYGSAEPVYHVETEFGPHIDMRADVPQYRLDDPGTSLSGGQQQRLCIARTIAIEPEVILMDEPCSALDPIATAIIEELIEELKTKYAIVIVTHSMQQAARISQKTAFFNLGKLMEIGDTTTMFTNPTHDRTKDYITGRYG